MSATPLIKSLNTQGGSFYAFSSAIQQQEMAASDDDIKFVFSKFVALKIPNVKTPLYKENNIQFLQIDGQIYNGISPYNAINVIQSFQNYSLNLESLLINSDFYNPALLKTVSERIFFKWLKEIGAIRYRNASTSEATQTRYVEEDTNLTGSQRYQKVVRYIGDIDVVNNVRYKGNSYTEVYLYMPSEAGNTPVVLFDSISDDNYQADMIITGANEYLYGRDSVTIHPDNLSLFAFYDYDVNMSYDSSTNANWYNQDPLYGNTNSYFTEPTEFSNVSNIAITKASSDYTEADPFTTIYYLRSRLDGVGLDFDAASYTDIVNDSTLNTIQEFNSSPKASNFDFNAVLVYYNIYNEKDPSVIGTNLYGILFLDNIIENVGESYIPGFSKYKFNNLTNQNGNSFGLRLNFRSSQSIYNSGVEIIINDYNTFSMGLFSEAIVQLQNSVINFQEQNSQLLNLSDRLDSIESIMYNISELTAIQDKLTELETSIINAQLSYAGSSVLLDLISSTNERINQILQNKTSLELSYNTDIIQAGKGIKLDKSVASKLVINSDREAYNITFVKDKDGTVINETNPYDLENNDTQLHIITKEFTNYIKIYTIDNAELENHLKIYLNDKNNKFQNGQTVRLVFNNTIDFKSYNIRIYSDYYNQHGFGSLGKIIANISFEDLSIKPIIELICLDKTNYTFDYNIIK